MTHLYLCANYSNIMRHFTILCLYILDSRFPFQHEPNDNNLFVYMSEIQENEHGGIEGRISLPFVERLVNMSQGATNIII